MNTIIDTILTYIQRFFEWVVSSGLAEKTADAFATNRNIPEGG